MNALGQEHAPIIFDMSLLSMKIVWNKPEELQGVIPLAGGMHFLMSLFAGIGHLYGEAGLRHLSDSGLYAPVTVANILSVKEFKKTLVAFKLVDEVLTMRFWQTLKLGVENQINYNIE
ncbi:hypothetical protein DPMN_185014 [Dreissena polymorpha]|uniref:Uncharacterized protein n=1 Tax=Dreissena polymorpha TaxID=45954 RepID=A0A9D4I6X1_DREPO|nr:hypothetical protein DPMN_185014 [Dreissena polymorpha]